jgi:hypothetical protein
LCVLASSRLLSQSTNATLSGAVTDRSSKVISTADIEIVNEATGVHYSSKTNTTGIYTVSILPPGRYSVQASKIGFKTIITPAVVLNVQSAVALNFTLSVGATSESITVEAGSSMINTTDASVSTVIDRKFVENIPLNGRSFQDLISMTPGVVTQNPQSTASSSGQIGANGDFSINGQRTESSNYIIDGVSANVGAGNGYGSTSAALGGGNAAATALGTTQSLVSVDALQEFRVLSSTYSAEYGRSPGGQFIFQTRSGTEKFHGNVFEYLRNNFFDANDWFNNHYKTGTNALRQNDFGGTIGGPLLVPGFNRGNHRAFFFGSYEGLRLVQPQAASIQYVPDLFLRQQAAATVRPLLHAFPLPTTGGVDYGTSSSPNLAQFIKPYSLPGQIDSGSLRLDKTFGEKLSLFVRAAYTPSSSVGRVLSVVNQIDFGSQMYTVGAASQFSSRLSNEFHAAYARSDAKVSRFLDNFGGATVTDLAGQLTSGNIGGPNVGATVYLNFAGVGNGTLTTGDTRNGIRQWNIVNTLNYTWGRHSVRVGADYRYIQAPYSYFWPSVSSYFYTASSITNNVPSQVIIQKLIAGTPITREFAVFAQDEWRVKSDVTLSLGLRWEINPPPTGANGQDAYTTNGDPSNPSTLQLAPRGTRLWQTPWYNFAPRLGLAWQAHQLPGRETVVRVGGGVFFDTDNQIAATGFSGVGFLAQRNFTGVSLPITAAQLNFSTSPTAPYGTVYSFPKHLQLPYTLEWNGSLEQALGKAQSLTISYVGANGRRQVAQKGSLITPYNPNFTYLYTYYGGFSSSYNALQTKFQRSMSHGVQALASYTWSHAIDFGSTYRALYLLRGNADFDVRHTFSAAVSWELPQPGKDKVLQTIFGDWGLDSRLIVRSGFPVILQGSSRIDSGNGSLYYTGANLLANTPIYVYGPQYPGGRAINPAAFSAPSGASVGNAPRNFVRGFGENQVNVALRKSYHPIDSLTVQFRAEAFNVLNHPNFGYVDPLITNATFGQATRMLNQSLGTVASQYQQGGPRSMQFALKLLF